MTQRTCAAIVVLFVVADVHAQRIVGMEAQVQGSASGAGMFYIGTTAIGESNVQTLLSGSVDGLLSGDSPARLRNAMMPENGIAGIGKRAFQPGGGYGIQVPASDDIQYWASADETNWVLIEPGAFTRIQVPLPSSSILFGDFRDTGSIGFQPSDSATSQPSRPSALSFLPLDSWRLVGRYCDGGCHK